MLRVSKILLLFFGLAVTGASQAQLPRQTVPGTRVSLVPPSDFSPTTLLAGFMHDSVAASIMVTEFEGSFAELMSGFTNTAELAKRGMELLDQQEAKGFSRNGCLLFLKHTIQAGEYRKWIFIFGDEKESVVMVATFRKDVERDLSDKMKASLLTARWDRDLKVVPSASFGFAVTEIEPLKLTKTLINLIIYTKSGVLPNKSLDEPLFVVGRAISNVAIADQEQFAKLRLSQTVTIRNIEIERLNSVTVDKLTGYEVFAKAIDTESLSPMVIYQLVLYEDSSYYLMQGLVSSKHRSTFLPVFERMAKSFRRT